MVLPEFYPKPWNIRYHRLERSHQPYADGFVPENDRDDGSEREDEQIFSGEAVHQKQQVCYIECGGEHGIEEVSRKQHLAKLDEVLQDAYLDLAD